MYSEFNNLQNRGATPLRIISMLGVTLSLACALLAVPRTAHSSEANANRDSNTNVEPDNKYPTYKTYKSKRTATIYRLIELISSGDSIKFTVYSDKGKTTVGHIDAHLDELGNDSSAIQFSDDGITVLNHKISLTEITKITDSVYRHPNIPGADVVSVTFWGSNSSAKSRRSTANRIILGDSVLIPENDFVRGSVVSFGSEITIAGEVNHSVIAIGGDIVVLSGAVIRDHAIALSGTIRREQGAKIYGHVIPNIDGKRPLMRRRPWENDRQTLSFTPIFTYNRVDGFTPRVGWDFEDQDSLLPKMTLHYGLATTSGRQRFRFTINQPLYQRGKVSLIGSVYQELKSDQEHLLPEWQNTLVALLARTDYRNYYEAEGVALQMRLRPSANYQISLGILTEDLRTISATRGLWSLFGGEKMFPANYQGLNPTLQDSAALEFNSRHFSALFVQAHASNERKFRGTDRFNEWRGAMSFERSLPKFDSDFTFTRAWAEISALHPITRYSNIEIRSFLGASSGEMPLYRKFYLGGYRWLRGYNQLELIGDSFWTIALDYEIRLDGAGLKPLSFWLFYDVGSIQGLSSQWNDYSSIGLGLSIDRTIRLNLAHRLDNSDPELRFFIEF